jgi:hypothetical protein
VGAFLRADDRTRTDDLLITGQMLYQLSYVGNRCCAKNLRTKNQNASVVYKKRDTLSNPKSEKKGLTNSEEMG